MTSRTECLKLIGISVVLVSLVLIIYWRVQDFEFIDYDDQLYVTENFRIQHGISLNTVLDTFRDIHTGHWHPLTMISHMMDWSLFGNRAGGHHWTNVILHSLNTVLLFLLLRVMTGAVWRSAFVAALFAIHPMNVESVAWVSERKNVLSTFFWITTVLFYVRYIRLPGWKRYIPVMISFILGLLSKPMLVTLPFVLLLFDYWPLQRTLLYRCDKNIASMYAVHKHKLSYLILEKIPLFFLTVASMVLTMYAAKAGLALRSLDGYSLAQRISNALLSYVLYIRKLIWPVDLSVYYPYMTVPVRPAICAALFLVTVTILVCLFYKKYPHLIVGWFFYLGTLIPVIGIVQVGRQAMADRYAYIPFIGLFIMIAWSIPVIKRTRVLTVTATSCVIIIFLIASFNYAGMWRNTVKLFEDLIQRNPKNYFAYNMLGLVNTDRGKNDKALNCFYMALKINPNYDPSYINVGNIFLHQGEYDLASFYYRKAVLINDSSPENHNNLGVVLMLKNDVEGGISSFKRAIELNSDYIFALNNLGIAQMQNKNIGEARRCFEKVLKLQPDNETAVEKMSILLHKNINEVKQNKQIQGQ